MCDICSKSIYKTSYIFIFDKKATRSTHLTLFLELLNTPVGCIIQISVGIYLYLKKENILKFKEMDITIKYV